MQKVAEELAANHTLEEIEAMQAEAAKPQEEDRLAAFARENDTPEGYEAFHDLIFGVKQTEHSKVWIRQIYEDHARGGGTVIFAHRDSAKTTDITQGFAAFRIGQDAIKSSTLLQVSDEIANRNSRVVARMIEENPQWKKIFPEVVPDEKSGWGVKTGFYVKDKGNLNWDVERTRFKDPAFVGGGVLSSAIGMRITGLFIVDDVHDLKNTRSPTKFETVKATVFSEYMPMLTKDVSMPEDMQKSWKIFVGTPWEEDDVLDKASKLNNYSTVATPVYQEVEGPPVTPDSWVGCDKDDRAAWFHKDKEGDSQELIGGKWVLGNWKKVPAPMDHSEDFAQDVDPLSLPMYYPRYNTWIRANWPEKFDLKYIEEKWDEAGGDIEFARMFLLDLTLSGERIFTWQDFDSDQVNVNWPMSLGVDFANIMKDSKKPERFRSNFALAVVADTPFGPIVVGGDYGRYTADDGEGLIMTRQGVYQNYRTTIIEGDGKGELFYHYFLRRNPSAVRTRMETTGGRGKTQRLEMELQPWLANGIVRVSDADDTYLNALRKEMRNFPHGSSTDALDALYWALFSMPHALNLRRYEMKEGQLPSTLPNQQKRTTHSPWGAGLGAKKS